MSLSFIKIPLTDNPPTLSVGLAGELNPRPPLSRPALSQLSYKLMLLLNLILCGLKP